MSNLRSLNLNRLAARPKLPTPRAIQPGSKEFESVVETETRIADATIAVTDEILDSTPNAGANIRGATERNIASESEKLSRLVDDDFPFDDSQLAAVAGLVTQKYACMIGAAGTGKTTVTKKLVDMLRDGLDEIDVSQYWKRGAPEDGDEYETPSRYIPSIAMVSYTGRASQMVKKNFPRDWHPNIMTIHRALGFYPEFYEDFDMETQSVVNKRRFVPAYTAENLMPWDIVIIDEAGMLGLDLWHQLYAACKPSCRIIMIGDINQLPPTHGKPILGFALASWPTWELTHIHRQQGANNSIVDNAHRTLKGLRPISDCPEPLDFKTPQTMVKALSWMVNNHDWRFLSIDIDDDHRIASQRIRQALKLLHGKLYEPNRDVVITPINGFEQTQPGFSLGQAPMNQALVTLLNQDSPRYLIDAGRERQNFAVGDKVMATVNDYEAGITNGMTGIVTSIAPNGGYIGETRRFGLLSEVNSYYDGIEDDSDDEEFSLEEVLDSAKNDLENRKKKEQRDAGPASHIVTVRFGEDDHAIEIAFASKSQVASLMLAYVSTCHKLQGGEAPLVFVILNQSHKRSLKREWLYTAITRASARCVLLTTRQGLGFALGKQDIRGVTLEQKIKVFAALTESGPLGPTVRVKLPQPRSLVTDVAIHTPKPAPKPEQPAEPRVVIRDRIIPVVVEVRHTHEVAPAQPKDGGNLTPEPKWKTPTVIAKPAPALPAPNRLVSQWGAIHMKLRLDAVKDGPLLLTYAPAPVQATAPTKPTKLNPLAALLAKQKSK